MSTNPFFSIVIPTFNRLEDLRFTLFCIMRQSFKDYEIIISDNCSTDKTKEFIKEIKDKRVRYYRNKENIGSIQNFKKALGYAKGEYIFFHGDDDFLIFESSLQDIFVKINKNKRGYIRVNYINQTPDKKIIFDFRATKSFMGDRCLAPNSSSEKILSFIFSSEASFITGLIFKNKISKKITIIDSDPLPWIAIMFYLTKQFGSYFISFPYIIGSWSEWKVKEEGYHPLYSLNRGRIPGENYFNFIKKHSREDFYKKFLHHRLLTSYVKYFPAIKVYLGNKKFKGFVVRIIKLNPDLRKSIIFWLYFIASYICPRFLGKKIIKIYFNMYVKMYEVTNKRIIKNLKKAKEDYSLFQG